MIILLSGAAGLIGGELAMRLAKAGHGVIALVHRTHDIRANDGMLVQTRDWGGVAPRSAEVAALPCDIAAPALGLTFSNQLILPKQADLVIHCAALTAFDASPEEYHAVNVAGTAKLLAVVPHAPFLHVSTAYVCGLKSGLITEAPRDPAYAFGNGYESSKADAEELVRAAGAAGRGVVIARPSIVIGTYDRGTIRSFDSIYTAFRLIAEGRIRTLPATADTSLDFVPIDHVIGGLTDIVAHWQAAMGKTIHLASGCPVSSAVFRATMARFPQFHVPEFLTPNVFSSATLPPMERRLYARVANVYASYFQRNPRFATDELARISGRVCPPLDAPALDRMIGYCIERGFLAAA